MFCLIIIQQNNRIYKRMGIVGALTNSCLPQNDEDRAAGLLYGNGKRINDDYAYFQQENWYRLQGTLLFDPNKFIFLDINYKETQMKLIERWKIVDTKKFKNNEKLVFNTMPLQMKWKFAIRKGVPIIYFKNVIELIFAKNFSLDSSTKKYQTLLYEKLKKTGNRVQLVTYKQQSEDAFSTPFLNKQGIQAAKRIAFVLSQTHSQLESNPYIIKVISLLLIFVSEEDAYDIVGTMIEGSTSISVERQQSLRWHFSLNDNQMDKFAREFYKTVKKVSPSVSLINDHLNTEGIEKFLIFKQIISQFFIGFLPFPVVLRIFLIYLNEGAKIFYRIFYAILKIAGQGIKDSNNTKQIIRVIRTKMLTNLNTDRNIKNFFKFAFDLKLENLINIKKKEIDMLKSNKQETVIYYLPEIEGASQILSYLDIETIWSFLPEVIKHYDAKKIFSTSENTPTLSRMLSVLQQHSLTLIIGESFDETVFGVFIAQKLKTSAQIHSLRISKSMPPAQLAQTYSNSQTSSTKIQRQLSNQQETLKNLFYFGSSETFVFTLSPLKRKFSSTGQNVFYLAYNSNALIIGGPSSSPALQIDTTLTQGISHRCVTYNNQPLHGESPGEFKIKMIECFSVQ